MDLLMNGLLMTATLFAGGYCWVLARRVRQLKSLDSGLGGAIVTLTRQVELARTTLEEARSASRDTRHDLAQLVAKADGAAGQLRLLIAAAPLPQPAPPAVEPAPPPAAAAAEPAPVVPIRPVPRAPEPRAELRAPETHAPEPQVAEIPKPRALAPVENPLRRKDPEPAPAHSEDDILEALSALAGGR
ncbi:hypothetical protein [Amaricoccus sp.]|uniref:hypothetical protein n=1 Tax=Amaricoccus sp. TaxID=1872485 RepID=UPI00262E351C|nr:hypothetical protein [Amaricoccus sp.]HRO10886.1 hypothetical protein [Amaricoccus sp.]